MLQCKIRTLLLGGVLIGLLDPMFGQELDASKERHIKIPSSGGEPSFVVRISATDRRGVVSVEDERGAEVQKLSCPLLRDNAEPTPDELAAVQQQFVTQFAVKELDFDGHPDLEGIREFGAKWARYCVWLYNPKQHIFVKDFLAEQLELLTNLQLLDGGQVSSSYIGPTNPWRAVYRVTGAKGSRPERQLVPLYSCLVETTGEGDKATAVVMTRYESGRAVVQRQEIAKVQLRAAFERCDSWGKTAVSQKLHGEN